MRCLDTTRQLQPGVTSGRLLIGCVSGRTSRSKRETRERNTPKGDQMTQQGPQSPGSQQQPQTGTQPPAGQPVAQPPSAGLSGPVPRADFGQRLGAILIDSVLTGVAGLIVFLIFGAIGAAIAATGSNAGVAIGGLIGTLGILLWIPCRSSTSGIWKGSQVVRRSESVC